MLQNNGSDMVTPALMLGAESKKRTVVGDLDLHGKMPCVNKLWQCQNVLEMNIIYSK